MRLTPFGFFKGGKTDLHEGGIRVPMVARWPNTILAGMTSRAFGHTNDLLPTFCEASGIDVSYTIRVDGKSLLPHLKGGAPLTVEERGTVFWQLNLYKHLQHHYPKPEPFATEVLRRGKWKLLALDGEPVELIDIHADPNELNNVMNHNPDIVESLTIELHDWLAAERVRQSDRLR